MSVPVLVSVVIPAFNAEETIDEAIESVCSQTHTNFECLVIDDGSTDGTRERIRRWQEKDPHRIRLLAHPNGENRGTAVSRNLGLDHATGEYVAFLDADDAWLERKLEVQLATFNDAGPQVGMVFSGTVVCRATAPDKLRDVPGTDGEDVQCLAQLFSGVTGSSLESLLFRPATEFINWVPSPTPLIRRSYLPKAIRFIGPPVLRTQFEDYLMWLILSTQCEFIFVPERLAYYRIHPHQFTSSYQDRSSAVDYLADTLNLLDVLQNRAGNCLSSRGAFLRLLEKRSKLILTVTRHVPMPLARRINTIPITHVPRLLRLAISERILLKTICEVAYRYLRYTLLRCRTNRLYGWFASPGTSATRDATQ